MITRIKINGFKSLVNTELYFGPFTCIAGENAVGKSNFFDALMFLSKLADTTIIEAVKSIRSEDQKHTNFSDVFFKSNGKNMDGMDFEVDLILPKESEDDYGQMATATTTTVRYILKLKLSKDNYGNAIIQILSEELKPITKENTKLGLMFSYEQAWIQSIFVPKKGSGTSFISTVEGKIKLHQDNGKQGKTTNFIPEKMPRTLLSSATAESPTAFLARQEMRNWMMLQFEPSALRKPNMLYEINNSKITANGSNLPATLIRLSLVKINQDVFQTLTNKLKGLVDGVVEILVDADDKRDLLTLQVKYKDGLVLPAQSLSDGTLRFLGLSIIAEDSLGSGLLCLEEPENGINPKKIKQIVGLLEEMAMDTEFAIDDENPLRQVIINTHSPIVVSLVSDESLYLAKNKEFFVHDLNGKGLGTGFSALGNTWKTKNDLCATASWGDIDFYLSNIISETPVVNFKSEVKKKKTVLENANQYKLNFDA